MSTLGYGLAGLGGLASMAGGFLGGQSQNRAARQAMDTYGARTSEGMNRLGMAFFGPSSFMDLLAGTEVDYGGGFRPEALEGAIKAGKRPEGMDDAQWERIQGLYGQWQQMQGFTDRMGGPVLDQLRGLGGQAQGMYDTTMGRYDADTARLSGIGQAMLGQRDRAAEGVMANAREGVGIAARYGQGREAQIRRDAGKAQNDLNDQTSALMAAKGFGGTLEANQRGANARGTQEAMQDAITRLREGQTDRMLAAQSGVTGTQAGLMSGRDAIQQAMLGNEYGRAGQRTAYDVGNINSQMGYRMMPVQSILGVMQGSVMNPWLNQNTSQYYPGASPIGTALQTGGNAAAGLGSSMLGQEWMKQLLASYRSPGGTNPPGVSQSAYGPFQP
jgi:hypothetical protein